MNDPALRYVRQQFERAIQAGFAAAIGAGHDVEFAEREPDVSQGPIPGDGKSSDHDAMARIDAVGRRWRGGSTDIPAASAGKARLGQAARGLCPTSLPRNVGFRLF